METEKRQMKFLNKKTAGIAIMLCMLLVQLTGCNSISTNPGTSSSTVTSSNPSAHSSSLSPIETEANATAINAWTALLNAHQGTPDYYLYTTVTNMAPSAVSLALSKGNTVTVAWQHHGAPGEGGTSGEAQINNFKSQVTALGLSPADQANGITWQGTVGIAFLFRYRSQGPNDNLLPPDGEPFSPWSEAAQEYAGTIFVSPVNISVVKQNGEWTTKMSGPFGLGWGWEHNLIGPLPLPFDYYDHGDVSYGNKPYMVKQTSENQSLTTPTPSNPTRNTQSTGTLTDAQLIEQAQQTTQGKPQPGNYSSCLVYAQARGLGVTAKGNTGAFNILYQGNDAKLINSLPTTQFKSGLKPLQNISNLTTVLQSGDFIVWQRGIAGANSDYGHIAVVELVESGRIVISQAGWSPTWKVLQTGDFVSGIYGYPRGLP